MVTGEEDEVQEKVRVKMTLGWSSVDTFMRDEKLSRTHYEHDKNESVLSSFLLLSFVRREVTLVGLLMTMLPLKTMDSEGWKF